MLTNLQRAYVTFVYVIVPIDWLMWEANVLNEENGFNALMMLKLFCLLQLLVATI